MTPQDPARRAITPRTTLTPSATDDADERKAVSLLGLLRRFESSDGESKISTLSTGTVNASPSARS